MDRNSQEVEHDFHRIQRAARGDSAQELGGGTSARTFGLASGSPALSFSLEPKAPTLMLEP